MASQWQRLAAAALVVLAFGACGGGDDDSGAGGQADDDPVITMPSAVGGAGGGIEVIGKEFSFSPATFTIKAGQPTKIVLRNIGSIEHDLTVNKADFKVKAGSGKTRDKELTIEWPGTYEFHCSIAGHKNAGMKGELTVE